MASIDLNIIQRGAASDFEWTAGPGRITKADLGNIGEQRTDNNSALNALPTPFARFYTFKEAFRRVLEERNNEKKPAGLAYEQLVSNCLDVFELLYNKKYHENLWKSSERKIIIKEWNYEVDLKTLKEHVPILGGAVESYFNDDLGEKKLFFIILLENGKEYFLATSSPMTGFITPPDMDKEVKDEDKGGASRRIIFGGDNYSSLSWETLRRKSSGIYFQDIQLFDKRDADFKNYMYTTLFGNGAAVDARYRELRDYIKSFGSEPDIKDTWTSDALKDILSDDNRNKVIVNGIALKTSEDLGSKNYFSDAVLKVPYKLASSKFKTFKYINDNAGRSYDYLLPLSEQALEVIGNQDFVAECKEKNQAIEIKIIVHGKEFKKIFRTDAAAVRAGEGTIISLETSRINFDLALFPNVLSVNDNENNYFKVLVSAFDNNDRRTFTVDSLNLDFYKVVDKKDKKYEIIEKAIDGSYRSGTRPAVIRSQQNSDVECGTKYYEVFNTAFDVILVKTTIDCKDYTFTLFPQWDRAETSTKTFDYAIDIGTTNTYISLREKGTMNEPRQLTMDVPIVSYLHDRINSTQMNKVSCWEVNTPEQFKAAFKTEFVPPFIDGHAYKFPIRTALCFTGRDTSKISLFDNTNIAFFYEKSKPAGNQSIITDIKWDSDEKKLRVFIRELLLIIKADMLQEHAIISKTGLIWFSPLSFKNRDREIFKRIWNEESKWILNLESPERQIKCYTESEAPYHYFNARDEYESVESVAILDIGGGSTDFVYFQKGKPKIANSIHFGCDVMWGNAFDQFIDSKKNGIYDRYKDTVHFDTIVLKELNALMVGNPKSTTQDIINFWISNNAETKIADKLQQDFSYAFAYHYTATIYYLASLLKANKLEYPRTITFSGNGSRYIDQYITSDIKILKEITHFIVSKVFDKEIADIQLVLPDIRKESTCYGGLYHKNGIAQPKAVVYYGNGKSETCKDVKELAEAYQTSIKDNVIVEVTAMNKIYAEVLSTLIRYGVVDNKENKLTTDEILNLVNSGVKDVLTSKFQTEIREKYSDLEQFNDTLFFIPVRDALLKLTNHKA